ncbi:MAG TPA: efflux RND transporter periplasmic adaptor subunit, partial [Bacteroidales bacterium]|nr:efflux RND transporter periplasmic adaptor subunit [Bacteroidales bacterium]
MKKKNKVVLSILICLFLLSGCDSPTKETTVAENVSYVKTAKATPIVISIPIRATGKLATRTEMKLSFKTGGILEELNVKEGQQVSKGMLLATLDLSEIDARVKQTATSYEKAKRDYQRAQNLYQDSVVTLETVQNAKSAYDIAIAEKEIAEFNHRHSRIKAPADGKIQKVLLEVNEISAPGHPVILFATTENDWVVR